MSKINIGSIVLGNKVVVSDPCYEIGIWCSTELDVLPGEYDCFVVNGDDPWGVRISSLIIQRKDTRIVNTEWVADIGVDSGQAGIFDYKYYLQHHPIDESKENLDEDWYHSISDMTLNEPRCGISDGVGFVSESGCGDGAYPVYIGKESNGYIAYIRIQFM